MQEPFHFHQQDIGSLLPPQWFLNSLGIHFYLSSGLGVLYLPDSWFCGSIIILLSVRGGERWGNWCVLYPPCKQLERHPIMHVCVWERGNVPFLQYSRTLPNNSQAQEKVFQPFRIVSPSQVSGKANSVLCCWESLAASSIMETSCLEVLL